VRAGRDRVKTKALIDSCAVSPSHPISIERAYAMAKALHADGVMTPHIYWDGR
jgi:hypothetical protein